MLVKRRRNGGLRWRVLTPAVFLLAGALAVTSAVSADGTDFRAGRYGDLASVVRWQTEEVDRLQAQVLALSTEVEELSQGVLGKEVAQAQAQVSELEVPAGLTAMKGPGLTIELDDAPADEIGESGVDPNFLIVHQQDIQAVVNAMWRGGAEAMTIQGQRIISTTGINCVGSTVVLHGVPYSPPYVITAIGDPAAMLASINQSPYINTYLDYVEEYALGWSLVPQSEVEVPPYEGSLALNYARPAGDAVLTEDSEGL
jgi:uncharacterized protein YlxW (UPF0749 family)